MAYVLVTLACATDGAPPESSTVRARPDPTQALTPDEPPCELTVQAPSVTRTGERSTVEVSLRARGGYHINHDAPLEVRVDSEVLKTDRPTYSLAQASARAAGVVTLEIPFTPAAPGQHTMIVGADFALCGELDCAICSEGDQISTLVH